jgi:hypothetical protein
MKLSDRLKKIEAKSPAEKKIIVVKIVSEIRELSFGEEHFYRLENESEDTFIKRIMSVVERSENRPMVTVLVGNY